ncbi:hypothetical protein KU45_01295 [Salmonella enterica subsp. enterica]|nr:hypothetical protein [Salmonella enterica subsp. enterica]
MFPAPAGINRLTAPAGIRWSRVPRATSFRRPESVPRASGDKPRNQFLATGDAMCSPRQRG